MSGKINIQRLHYKIPATPERKLARFFWPGQANANRIIKTVLNFDEKTVEQELQKVRNLFEKNHINFTEILEEHFENLSQQASIDTSVDTKRKWLLGAHFTMEYAFECAALFNPSMIPAHNQQGVDNGYLRFIMSLRAVGEGHVSSIVFRRGLIGPDGNITVNPPRLRVRQVKMTHDTSYDKKIFRRKLEQMNITGPIVEEILVELPNIFTDPELTELLARKRQDRKKDSEFERIANVMSWLSRSDYRVKFDDIDQIEEMILFPISESESQGIEDMRLVAFTDENGESIVYGTYTAFNGRSILPQLIEVRTDGIGHVQTLHGKCAQNKGMALFPEKFDGKYYMIGRIDGTNLFLMKSDDVCIWNDAEIIYTPTYLWETIQVGNCGSPLKTDAGWLLITHGVGPMRRYCIGAILLDLKDPSKVIGTLKEPLLEPIEGESSGYVPNVVYSCGGLIHNGNLVLPYGISDTATGFAIIKLDELLSVMK